MPVGLIGRTVRVTLHASEVVVYDGRKEVARHERLIAKGQARLELDHYLEALVRKPGAFPGATALEQARSAGKFTPVHDVRWAVPALAEMPSRVRVNVPTPAYCAAPGRSRGDPRGRCCPYEDSRWPLSAVESGVALRGRSWGRFAVRPSPED